MTNRRLRIVGGAAAACSAALALAVLVLPPPASHPLDELIELVASIIAAAACVVAGRRKDGRARTAWYLVAAGAAARGAGQGAWAWLDLILHQGHTVTPVADAFFVASVPLLLSGLLTMPVWPAGWVAKLRVVCDGLLAAGGILLLSGHTVLTTVIAGSANTGPTQVLSIASPVGDVIVVTVLAIMWSRVSSASRTPILLATVGLLLVAVSDAGSAYALARGTFASGDLVGIGWVSGYLVLGVAALSALRRPESPRPIVPPTLLTAAAPYAPVPVVIAFGAHEWLRDGAVSRFTLLIGVALFVLVLLRQGLAVRENVRLVRLLASNESELNHRAEHDPLTNLNNRGSFIRFVDQWLGDPTSERICAVMFVDLDDFKHINDSLGHAMGDQAIVAVGERLRSCMRSHDLVARLGGDEFAVFLTRLPNVNQLVSIAERLIETLNEPFQSSDMRASVCGTIGIAIAEPGDDAGELLRRADIAMYAAKARGKGMFGIFEPSMHVAMYAPLERRADLERAAEAEEFTLFFQPVVDVPTRALVGVEALIRWEHPRLGMIGPLEFTEDLESAGLMIRVGTWVLNEACRQGVRLREVTGDDLFVSVNVSSSQMLDSGFVAAVSDALAGSGLPADALVVELTESGSVGDSEVVGLRLRQLRLTGVRVAIDDFGSGYSSFTYLRRLRVDILKIDKSFMDDLLLGGSGGALVEGMIGLGNSLGLLTIGEGVEDGAQHAALVKLGCSMAQGYLHARPMPMDQILSDHRARQATPGQVAGGALRAPAQGWNGQAVLG